MVELDFFWKQHSGENKSINRIKKQTEFWPAGELRHAVTVGNSSGINRNSKKKGKEDFRFRKLTHFSKGQHTHEVEQNAALKKRAFKIERLENGGVAKEVSVWHK